VLQGQALEAGGTPYTPSELLSVLVLTGDPVTDPKNRITTPRVNLGNALSGLEVCTDGVDNDGDTLADCADPDCQTDQDGDTISDQPCGPDCDGANPRVWGPPAEVAGVRWEGRTVLLWDSLYTLSGPGTSFQLLRGRVDELPAGGGPSETCLAATLPATSYLDRTATTPGDLYYFLIRGKNSCSPSGVSYGADSRGTARTSTTCP
jgi:hypothetical protein